MSLLARFNDQCRNHPKMGHQRVGALGVVGPKSGHSMKHPNQMAAGAELAAHEGSMASALPSSSAWANVWLAK